MWRVYATLILNVWVKINMNVKEIHEENKKGKYNSEFI